MGQVQVAKNGMADFRIRDRDVLLTHIIPLFDQHLLLTSKYYNYVLFKKALLVSTNRSFTTLQKHQMLTSLRAESVAQYKSFTTLRSVNVNALQFISPA